MRSPPSESGKEQKIVLQASQDLTREQVEKLVEEAKANAESDKARQALMEAIARADLVVKDVKEVSVQSQTTFISFCSSSPPPPPVCLRVCFRVSRHL
jgi:molecular chaperone DnaK (HSP70)